MVLMKAACFKTPQSQGTSTPHPQGEANLYQVPEEKARNAMAASVPGQAKSRRHNKRNEDDILNVPSNGPSTAHQIAHQNGIASYYNSSQADIPNILVDKRDGIAEKGILDNYQQTNLKGIKKRVDNKLSVEENIRNLIKVFSELNNKGYNSNHKTQTTKGKSCTRKRKNKDGLGIKYSKLSLNILGAN